MSSFRNLVDELFVSWVCDVTRGFRWCAVQLYPIAWSLWTKLPETESTNTRMSKNVYAIVAYTNTKRKKIDYVWIWISRSTSNRSQFALRLFARFMSHVRETLFRSIALHLIFTTPHRLSGQFDVTNEENSNMVWSDVDSESIIHRYLGLAWKW